VDSKEKAKILAGKFFPITGNADLSDIIAEEQPERRQVDVTPNISPEEISELVRKLPNNKAPGPDEIPNEILKIVVPETAQSLAKASSQCLAGGMMPRQLKESITIVLRKEGKKDYSLPGSYRPIALKNSLAKVLEKRVANVMAEAAESHNLLLEPNGSKEKAVDAVGGRPAVLLRGDGVEGTARMRCLNAEP
jgi:hypothetical protein